MSTISLEICGDMMYHTTQNPSSNSSVYALLAHIQVLLRYWVSIARGWWFKISVGDRDTTLSVLWKNHRITLIKLPWKHLESSSTHFCFPIFWGRIVSKNENFDAVVIHQFWSKLPETKPQWLILVHITPNFVPKTHFLELRCPTAHLNRDNFESNLSVPGIQRCHENALYKSLETSPHLICL